MEEYSVTVLNELTGETTIVLIASVSAKDAQVLALTQVFREEGWRKASARVPQGAAIEALSA
jgi:hypothetical protein